MRGAFYFIDHGGVELYLESVFRSYWTEGKDISEDNCLISIVSSLDISPDNFLEFINIKKDG